MTACSEPFRAILSLRSIDHRSISSAASAAYSTILLDEEHLAFDQLHGPDDATAAASGHRGNSYPAKATRLQV